MSPRRKIRRFFCAHQRARACAKTHRVPCESGTLLKRKYQDTRTRTNVLSRTAGASVLISSPIICASPKEWRAFLYFFNVQRYESNPKDDLFSRGGGALSRGARGILVTLIIQNMIYIDGRVFWKKATRVPRLDICVRAISVVSGNRHHLDTAPPNQFGIFEEMCDISAPARALRTSEPRSGSPAGGSSLRVP